jgi:hypothetical protein
MAERFRAMAAVAAVVLGAGAGRADVWDALPSVGGPDDFNCATTIVELVHGVRQVHDLRAEELFPDRDWARVQQRAHRSYEVRLTNSAMLLAQGSAAARRACDGTVLTAGRPYEGSARDAISIPWLSSGDEPTFILTDAGFQGTHARYEIQLLETTYAVPRYNNSATQQTILVLQNTRPGALTGVVSFFSGAGAVPIHLQPIAIPARGVLVLNTSTLAALAGTSGSALVAHDGGYGALAGKAVALESGTGFTFDTPIVPKPY